MNFFKKFLITVVVVAAAWGASVYSAQAKPQPFASEQELELLVKQVVERPIDTLTLGYPMGKIEEQIYQTLPATQPILRCRLKNTWELFRQKMIQGKQQTEALFKALQDKDTVRATTISRETAATQVPLYINAYDQQGNTLLIHAVQQRLEDIVDILLRHSAILVNHINKQFKTALDYCDYQNKNLYNKLRAEKAETGVFLQLPDNDENVPKDWITQLKEKNFNIDTQDFYGDTLLHLAAWFGMPTTVQLLLQAGANRTIKNKNGKTALDMAKNTFNKTGKGLLLSERLERVIQLLTPPQSASVPAPAPAASPATPPSGAPVLPPSVTPVLPASPAPIPAVPAIPTPATPSLAPAAVSSQGQTALLQQQQEAPDQEASKRLWVILNAEKHDSEKATLILTDWLIKYRDSEAINTPNDQNMTPLMDALQRGLNETARALLTSAKINVNHMNNEFKTALDIAAKQNPNHPLIASIEDREGLTGLEVILSADDTEQLAQQLIQNFASAGINKPNFKNNTLLHIAASFGMPKAVQALLNNGADTSLKNIDNKTALELAQDSRDQARQSNDYEELKSLEAVIKTLTDVEEQRKKKQAPAPSASPMPSAAPVPAILPAQSSEEPSYKSEAASVPQTGQQSVTQKINSLIKKKDLSEEAIIEQLKELIKNGADINAPSSTQFQLRPLETAINNKKPRVVSFLIENGADINAQRKNGQTAIMIAQAALEADPQNKELKQIVSILNSHFPLHLAVQAKNTDLLERLLATKGVDINILNAEGLTALDVARALPESQERTQIIKLLKKYKGKTAQEELQLGADHPDPDQRLTDLLDKPVGATTKQEIATLIKQGANINAIDNDGDSRLINAVLAVRPEVVAVLLSFKALNINLTNKDGDTALTIAKENLERLSKKKALSASQKNTREKMLTIVNQLSSASRKITSLEELLK